ncbi:tudor domain-containing protein 15-like isoform X2 [Stigmatopora argus]
MWCGMSLVEFISASKSGDFGPDGVELTHLEWRPEGALILFEGKSPTRCEDHHVILHQEIQEAGDCCLVEHAESAVWYRRRVRARGCATSDVFLIDRGVVLSAKRGNEV